MLAWATDNADSASSSSDAVDVVLDVAADTVSTTESSVGVPVTTPNELVCVRKFVNALV